MRKNFLKFIGYLLLCLLAFIIAKNSFGKTLLPSEIIEIYQENKIIDYYELDYNEILIAYEGEYYRLEETDEVIANDIIKTPEGIKIYYGSFLREHGNARTIEYGTTTITMFDSIVNIDNISLKFSDFFEILYANAQTSSTTYATSSDGSIREKSSGASWNTLYSGSGGAIYQDVIHTGWQDYTGISNNYETIFRGRLTFILPGFDDYPDEGYIYLMTQGIVDQLNDDPDFGIYGMSPVSSTTLQSADYAGAEDTLFSDEINFDNIEAVDTYNIFTLSSSTLLKLNLDDFNHYSVRTDFDAENNPPTDENNTNDKYITFYASEEGGVNKDPYLYLIWYPEATSTPTTTPIVYNYTCEPDDTNQLDMITSCSFASTSGVTYINYRVRFINYILLFIPFAIVTLIIFILYFYLLKRWTKH